MSATTAEVADDGHRCFVPIGTAGTGGLAVPDHPCTLAQHRHLVTREEYEAVVAQRNLFGHLLGRIEFFFHHPAYHGAEDDFIADALENFRQARADYQAQSVAR